MHIFRWAALCAIFLGAFSSQAFGAIVTFAFTGHVTQVNFTNANWGFVVGAQAVGRVVYDAAAPLSPLAPGLYQTQPIPPKNGQVSSELTLNGIPTYPLSTSDSVFLANDFFLESKAVVDGLFFGGILAVIDPSQSLFPPGAAPPLSAISPMAALDQLSRNGKIYFTTFGAVNYHIEGVIDSIHLVPEPSTFALGLLAAAGLVVGLRRRR